MDLMKWLSSKFDQPKPQAVTAAKVIVTKSLDLGEFAKCLAMQTEEGVALFISHEEGWISARSDLAKERARRFQNSDEKVQVMRELGWIKP